MIDAIILIIGILIISIVIGILFVPIILKTLISTGKANMVTITKMAQKSMGDINIENMLEQLGKLGKQLESTSDDEGYA